MIRQLNAQNFTILPDDEWRFSPALNVIIGENGVGKTHLLKLLYTLVKVHANATELNKSTLERAYAQKLLNVFRSEHLGRLVKRKQGRERCEVALLMERETWNSRIAFATNAKSQVNVLEAPNEPLSVTPVYFPPRELMTLYPWFLPIYNNFETEFEETWYDTTFLLGTPPLKGARKQQAAALLRLLEEAMRGRVDSDRKTGRLYLHVSGEGRMEMPLVAEGVNKIAQLARLLANGTLLEQGYLFWDEPEANLNPRLMKVVARSIVELAASGVQVFVATHSLFLLREFEIVLGSEKYAHIPCRWMALAKDAHQVVLEQSDRVDEIETIVALEEEMAQSERFVSFLESQEEATR